MYMRFVFVSCGVYTTLHENVFYLPKRILIKVFLFPEIIVKNLT